MCKDTWKWPLRLHNNNSYGYTKLTLCAKALESDHLGYTITILMVTPNLPFVTKMARGWQLAQSMTLALDVSKIEIIG